jgi:hypothetical protein
MQNHLYVDLPAIMQVINSGIDVAFGRIRSPTFAP